MAGFAQCIACQSHPSLHTHTHTHTDRQTQTHTHTHTHKHRYTHTRTRTHAHTHTHTQVAQYSSQLGAKRWQMLRNALPVDDIPRYPRGEPIKDIDLYNMHRVFQELVSGVLTSHPANLSRTLACTTCTAQWESGIPTHNPVCVSMTLICTTCTARSRSW